jgi:hypothetical protein
MENLSIDQSGIHTASKSRRRKWTDEAKLEILAEAEEFPVSAVARKHGIAPSMLFQWRKQNEGRYVKPANFNPAFNGDETLEKLNQLESIETPIISKLVSDLRQNKLTAYNAACAYGSLVGAVTKRIAMRLEAMDHLIRINEFNNSLISERGSEDPLERECRLEAERILIELVNRKKDHPERCLPRDSRSDTHHVNDQLNP